MSSLLKQVNDRTNVAGTNRFQMLTFKLNQQTYGINVFKVREIIQHRSTSAIPGQADGIDGVVSVRGETIGVVDLHRVLGTSRNKKNAGFFIITEFSRHTYAIWVDFVERIHHVNWSEVSSPPAALRKSAITSVVNFPNGEMISVLDFESLLSHLTGKEAEFESNNEDASLLANRPPFMVVDDSRAARKMVSKHLKKMGAEVEVFEDGQSALDHLLSLGDVVDIRSRYSLIISDIEMPRMDGYSLTRNIKTSPSLGKVPVMLHSSLSGQFNESLTKSVGADFLLPKFDAQELQELVLKAIA